MPDDTTGRFFLPGPTEVRRPVLEAMLQPMIGHRGGAFEALFARIQEGLRPALRTAQPVYVSSSSATGLMEGAVRCAPEGAVLSVVNGAFSDRFAEIARGCGREVTVLEIPWGEVASPDDVARALRARPHAAVTVAHSETSTGALTDVRAIAEAAHAHGAVVLVDSVTGAGGAPLEPDRWQLDFVLTGSQKAFAIPPGLAFGVAQPSFVEQARRVAGRGRYFDVVEFDQYARRHQTPNTPAISLLYALDAQLAHIAREGIEARWARHAAMMQRTHAWVADTAAATGLELGVLAREGARSPTVTAVTLPERIGGTAVVRAMAARGWVIGDGYGRVKPYTFRIGHMGDHTVDGLAGCLTTCGEVLGELEVGTRDSGSGTRG